MTTLEKLDNMIAGLQEMRDFLKVNPELNEIWIYPGQLSWILVVSDKKKFNLLARKLVKGKGKIEKQYDAYSCTVIRKFSDNVSIKLNIGRDKVCERIVTGTKTVPSHYVSHYVPEHEEDIVEWKCK